MWEHKQLQGSVTCCCRSTNSFFIRERDVRRNSFARWHSLTAPKHKPHERPAVAQRMGDGCVCVWTGVCLCLYAWRPYWGMGWRDAEVSVSCLYGNALTLLHAKLFIKTPEYKFTYIDAAGRNNELWQCALLHRCHTQHPAAYVFNMAAALQITAAYRFNYNKIYVRDPTNKQRTIMLLNFMLC